MWTLIWCNHDPSKTKKQNKQKKNSVYFCMHDIYLKLFVNGFCMLNVCNIMISAGSTPCHSLCGSWRCFDVLNLSCQCRKKNLLTINCWMLLSENYTAQVEWLCYEKWSLIQQFHQMGDWGAMGAESEYFLPYYTQTYWEKRSKFLYQSKTQLKNPLC